MFNSYEQNIKVNAVNGTLVKNYVKSFFYRFRGDSNIGRTILKSEIPHFENFDSNGRLTHTKNIVVLQCMIVGEDEYLAEIMWKEDFDAMFGEVDKTE